MGRHAEDWQAVQHEWITAWTETTHLEVLQEQRPYDVRTYGEYLEWYVPRSRTRLTRPQPERPEQVTH